MRRHRVPGQRRLRQDPMLETVVEVAHPQPGKAVRGDGRQMSRAWPTRMGDHGAVVAHIADGHAMRPVETVAVVHPFERGVGVGNEQQRPMVGESGINETAVEQRYLRDGPIGRVRDEQPCDMFADGGLEVRDQDDEQPGGEVVGETVRTAGCAQRTWITEMVDEINRICRQAAVELRLESSRW